MPPRQIPCPECGAHIRVSQDLEPGMSVSCPSCGATARVPAGDFTASPPPAPRRPREEFTDAPRAGDDLDSPDGPRRGLGPEGLSNAYSIRIGDWFRYAQAHWGAVLGPMIGYYFLLVLII